jgi:hypothetical protein
LVAGLLTAVAMPTHAQSPAAKTTAAKAAKSSEGDLPDTVELSVFGGGSFFKQVNNGLGTKLANGGVVGARVTENFWKYFGLEQSYSYSTNNLRFVTSPIPGWPAPGYGNRIHHWFMNPVVYFTPKGSKVRPFVTVGIGAADYVPTNDAKVIARSLDLFNSNYKASALNSNLQVAMNYGGGLKFHITDHLGFRVDVRGLLSRNPTFMLPDYQTGGVYIPRHDKLHGLQTTAGLTYYWGAKAAPPPPPPPPPPPVKQLAAINGGSLSGGEGLLCQGKAITVSSNASDPEGHNLTYRWKVNGQPAGGNAATLNFTPDRGGDYKIELEVVDATDSSRTATSSPMTLSVKEYTAPTATSCSASPAQINAGDSSNLSMTGTGSPCSQIKYKWTTTEGTIANDTSATTSFDSKSVAFEPSGRVQTKSITATGTVTDDRGATANCTAAITVTSTPKSIRFADIVFAKGSARVNNCGKRILLEEVAQKAADADYEVVLVGHVAEDEVAKGKLRKGAKTLDEQRVENVAAVLSGGTGTCAKVDSARVKADWVGTDQTADVQPGLCGTSTRAETKERKTSKVSTSDEKRRVEVWLVPKGTAMPPSVKGLKVIPEKDLKKLGCPK